MYSINFFYPSSSLGKFRKGRGISSNLTCITSRTLKKRCILDRFFFLLDIQLFFRSRIIAVLASKKLWQGFCETFLKISFISSSPSFVRNYLTVPGFILVLPRLRGWLRMTKIQHYWGFGGVLYGRFWGRRLQTMVFSAFITGVKVLPESTPPPLPSPNTLLMLIQNYTRDVLNAFQINWYMRPVLLEQIYPHRRVWWVKF